MNPEVDQILMLSASQLMGGVAPLLSETYAQGQAALLSFMMILSAQEYERAADIRASENADMRALFRELAASVDDNDLRARLLAAAATRDESLTISALNKSNGELRRLVIALQSHAEQMDNGREAEARIWEILKRSAARRLVKLA
jgi:hypothetical protein